MYVQNHGIDVMEILPIFFGVLIGMAIILWGIYFFIKKQDDKKPIVKRKAKILEKPVEQFNVVWYVVEFENGERKKLRSFQGNGIILAVGDKGTISFQGNTIKSFQREV